MRNWCLQSVDIDITAAISHRDSFLTAIPHTSRYFDVLHGYKRFCCIRYTASPNSAYYCKLYLYTQSNHVCDFITLNYTSMAHCVGIYQGTDAFYRDLTRISVSDIKSEWI